MISETDVATPATAQTPKKTGRKRINYAMAATLIASGLSYEETAQRVGAASANCLRVGLQRKGVSANQMRSLPLGTHRIESATTVLAMNVATEASKILKERMSSVLDRHTEALQRVPARASLKHIARVGQALEPLARTAKIVHGWGDEAITGIVALGVVERLDRPDCGVDAPTGSVPMQAEKPHGIQDAQVIDLPSDSTPAD